MKRIVCKDRGKDVKEIAKIMGCSHVAVYDALNFKNKNSHLAYKIRKVAIESFGAQEVEFPDIP